MKQRAFENIVEKGENASDQHFLLFPECFPTYQGQKSSKTRLSAITINLKMLSAKSVSFGKGKDVSFSAPNLICFTFIAHMSSEKLTLWI